MKKESVESIVNRTNLKTLPSKQLQHLLLSTPKSKLSRYIIAAYSDFITKELVLFRGNGTNARIPFDHIEPNNLNSPDFSRLEVTEYGSTVELGDYIASSYSLLREFDSIQKLKPYVDYIDVMIKDAINAGYHDGKYSYFAYFTKEKIAHDRLPNVEVWSVRSGFNSYKIGTGCLIYYYDGWSINSGLNIITNNDFNKKLGHDLFLRLVKTKNQYN